MPDVAADCVTVAMDNATTLGKTAAIPFGFAGGEAGDEAAGTGGGEGGGEGGARAAHARVEFDRPNVRVVAHERVPRPRCQVDHLVMLMQVAMRVLTSMVVAGVVVAGVIVVVGMIMRMPPVPAVPVGHCTRRGQQ